MPSQSAGDSAEGLYCEARKRWGQIVDLGVYDDADIIRPVGDLLEQAREQDPRHASLRVLLSEILMQLGADEEALEVVDELIASEPGNAMHAKKRSLLAQLQADRSQANEDAVLDFVAQRWNETTDG